MKLLMKILFTQFVAIYWKKFVSLTVVGSLLLSVIGPVVEARTIARQTVSDVSNIERDERERGFGSYKLRRQLLSSRLVEAENKVIQMAESRIPAEQLPTAIAEYKRGLKRKGILRVESRPRGLRGSQFRISSLRRSIGSITSLHRGRIGRAIDRLTTLHGRRVWDSIESMTALHAGTILMHLRNIFDNYSLFHMPPTIINNPQTFAYLFRAALDGNRDQVNKITSYVPHVARKDSKWEYITEMGISNQTLFPRLLTRIMEGYVEQWKVKSKDTTHERRVDEEWVEFITKADRTIGDYHLTPYTDEELMLEGKFRSIYRELTNREGKYAYFGLDHVFVSLYDGPGFIWSEDVFQLAYYYTRQTKLNAFDRAIGRDKGLKDKDYERKGYFWIDRRYAHILIEYGKKHGEEALMKLLRTHAMRELGLRAWIHTRGRKGPYRTYDIAHDEVLNDPEQKELLEFAKRAANDIRLGCFPDYLFVRNLVDTLDDRIAVVPENPLGLFGEYLITLNMIVRGRRSHTPSSARTLKDIFRMIRRDQDLYLEYKKEVEELLQKEMGSHISLEELIKREREGTRDQLEAVRERYNEMLKEKEKQGVIRSFALRYPRFARLFGPEMIVNNIEALLDLEKRVEKSVEDDGWTDPGKLIFDIFSELFRKVTELVTSDNFMEVAEDLFKVMKMYRIANASNDVYEPLNELGFMMKYFGAKRAKKKFHQMVGFYSKMPVFCWALFKKRIRLEERLRWLHPDTYRRMEEEKKYNSSVHWMKRMRDEHLETWYSWILYVGVIPVAAYILSGGAAYSYDGYSMLHASLNIWNEIVRSISSLLPYFTVGVVSVSFGATLDKWNQGLDAKSNLNSPKNDVQQAVMDIAEKAGDEEGLVQAILTQTLYQALKGIVEDHSLRVLIHRADLMSQIKSLKRLMEE